MMNNTRFLAVMVLFISGLSPSLQAQTIDEILKVWRAREEKVKSAHFELVQDYDVPAGSLPARLDPRGEASAEEGFPAESIYPRRLYNFTFKNEMMLTDIVHPSFDSEEPEKTFVTKTGYDGNEARMLRPPGAVNYKQGTIFTEDWNPDAVDAVLKPLILAFRAHSQKFYRGSLKRFRIKQRSIELNGIPCVLVEETPAEGSDHRVEFWLDPARDYCMVRYDFFVGLTKLAMRLDIEYETNPVAGWVPIKWFETRTGMISGTSMTEVAKYELNPEIPDSQFTIEFPVGTVVIDNRKSRNNTRFIIQQDGYWRPVLPSESLGGATHSQLMKTRPGEALQYSPLRSFLSKLSIGIATLIVGVVLWRKVRAAPSRQ